MTLAVLMENGYTLPDDDKTFEFVREVAMGLYTREEIADWLRENAVRFPSVSKRHRGSF